MRMMNLHILNTSQYATIKLDESNRLSLCHVCMYTHSLYNYTPVFVYPHILKCPKRSMGYDDNSIILRAFKPWGKAGKVLSLVPGIYCLSARVCLRHEISYQEARY